MRSSAWLTGDDVERLATRVLDRHGASAPPVNVDEIANAHGLDFVLAEFETLSGSYMRDEDGRAHAMINRHHSRARRRFTKAHELAHHLIDEPSERRIPGFEHLRLPAGYRGRDRHWAHERFAAALLMPREWIGSFMRERGWRLERRRLVFDVARTFDVSMTAAEVRLRELGHIS